MNILHLVPHLGGGVKVVLLSWAINDNINNHIFMSLGYADEQVEQLCNKNNIKIFSNAEYNLICKYVQDFADIVVIHYWNFPLLLDFLIQKTLPKCRVITWFHNSGFYAPYNLPKEIIEYSDKFIFTSPISYELEVITNLPKESKDKLGCIWSTGGIEKYKDIKQNKHEGFNILYVGTLDFAKMYNNFVEVCFRISKQIPEANFIICGTGSSEQEIIEQTEFYGIRDKFIFAGLVKNLIPYFEIADIFLYLLEPTHFGTAEQILGEVMASGIIPVVFRNKCEKQIVENNINGYIISTDDECLSVVQQIYNDKDKLTTSSISLNASISAQEKYSIEIMINDWNKLFNEVILLPKKERQWFTNFKDMYGEGTIAFLESLDYKIATAFQKYITYEQQIENIFNSNLQWQSTSKGSIKQYLQYFPNDKYLNKFQKIMNK